MEEYIYRIVPGGFLSSWAVTVATRPALFVFTHSRRRALGDRSGLVERRFPNPSTLYSGTRVHGINFSYGN